MPRNPQIARKAGTDELILDFIKLHFKDTPSTHIFGYEKTAPSYVEFKAQVQEQVTQDGVAVSHVSLFINSGVQDFVSQVNYLVEKDTLRIILTLSAKDDSLKIHVGDITYKGFANKSLTVFKNFPEKPQNSRFTVTACEEGADASVVQTLTSECLNPCNLLACGDEHSSYFIKDAVCQRPLGHDSQHIQVNDNYSTWDEGGASSSPGLKHGIITRCASCDVPMVNTKDLMCFQCDFWTDTLSQPGSLIYKGSHYRWGSSDGFGGAEITITMIDKNGKEGTTVTRKGLWHQGKIPVGFREQAPDNCIIHNWA